MVRVWAVSNLDVLLNFKASAADTRICHGLKTDIFGIYGPLGILSMPYSCIKRQFMKIYRAGYSRCIIRKRRES